MGNSIDRISTTNRLSEEMREREKRVRHRVREGE